MDKKNSNIKTLINFLSLAWSTSKKFCVSIALFSILNIVITFLQIYLIKVFTDVLLTKSFNKWLVVLLPFLFGLFLIKNLVNILEAKLEEYSMDFSLKLEGSLIQKVTSISYASLENPDFLNLQEKASFSLNNQNSVENLLVILIDSIKNISIILSSIFIISFFSFSMILILMSLIIIKFLTKKLFTKKELEFFENLAPLNRKYWYYRYMIFDKNIILDIKTNHFEPHIINKLLNSVDKNIEVFNEYYRRQGIMAVIGNIISNTSIFFIIAFISKEMLENKLTISSFNFNVAAILNFAKNLDELSENILDLDRFIKYTEPVLELFNYEDKEKAGDIDNEYSFNNFLNGVNIDFRYDNPHNNILENINFSVDKNKVIVVIGENGAGKTTLMKLVSGLYKNFDGELIIENKPIKSLNFGKYSYISAVFQDYKLLNDISIRENIISELIDDNNIEEVNLIDEKIEHLMKELDMNLNISLDSKLGRELDNENIELSSGQKQLVAILRGLYKDSPILIMDEPTANIDVFKERKIFEAITKFKENKIIFLVSHRLSSVYFADEIWVMKEGLIIDKGKHQDLVLRNEYYKSLYDAQADLYLKN